MLTVNPGPPQFKVDELGRGPCVRWERRATVVLNKVSRLAVPPGRTAGLDGETVSNVLDAISTELKRRTKTKPALLCLAVTA